MAQHKTTSREGIDEPLSVVRHMPFPDAEKLEGVAGAVQGLTGSVTSIAACLGSTSGLAQQNHELLQELQGKVDKIYELLKEALNADEEEAGSDAEEEADNEETEEGDADSGVLVGASDEEAEEVEEDDADEGGDDEDDEDDEVVLEDEDDE